MLRVSPSKGANVRATLQNFESSLARFNTHLKVPSSCWRFQIDRFSSLVQDSGFDFSIPGVLHHLTIELIASVQRPHVRFTAGPTQCESASNLPAVYSACIYGFPVSSKVLQTPSSFPSW